MAIYDLFDGTLGHYSGMRLPKAEALRIAKQRNARLSKPKWSVKNVTDSAWHYRANPAKKAVKKTAPGAYYFYHPETGERKFSDDLAALKLQADRIAYKLGVSIAIMTGSKKRR